MRVGLHHSSPGDGSLAFSACHYGGPSTVRKERTQTVVSDGD